MALEFRFRIVVSVPMYVAQQGGRAYSNPRVDSLLEKQNRRASAAHVVPLNILLHLLEIFGGQIALNTSVVH